ncbi:MAG TPA: hypothetical protein VK766_10800 [Cytophagaceae bacterium]|jgi:hypothetical protein|nr:hypothetical protein [Cytophagaceae bacterium]
MQNESRNTVIDSALMIEFSISQILGMLLDISTEDSKTLSNKSTSLSLKTKIDLLTDIRALDRKEAIKFENFLQVRNQFVHNSKAKNYESCFSFIDGLGNKLLKDYPQKDELTQEEKLEKAFGKLFNDIIKSLKKLYGLTLTKKFQDTEGFNNSKIIESMHEVCNGLENGEQIIKMIYKRCDDKLNNLDKE